MAWFGGMNELFLLQVIENYEIVSSFKIIFGIFKTNIYLKINILKFKIKTNFLLKLADFNPKLISEDKMI